MRKQLPGQRSITQFLQPAIPAERKNTNSDLKSNKRPVSNVHKTIFFLFVGKHTLFPAENQITMGKHFLPELSWNQRHEGPRSYQILHGG